MTDAAPWRRPSRLARALDGISARYTAWRNARIANPAFQDWASRFPLTRRTSRRAAEQVYDLVSGFVYSQTLLACVEFGLLHEARRGAFDPRDVAEATHVDPGRLTILCQAAASLDLLERRRDGRYGLGRLGAAVLGVPGLEAMIRHHRIFYRDLADPDALIRGETEPELARYWPYVGGGKTHELPADTARTYSELMESSQHIVAVQTLRAVSLSGVSHLVDIGGGTGAFLGAVAARYPRMRLTLFDLPSVVQEARSRLAGASHAYRIETVGGSFLDGSLPTDADAISLIRVLYDHDDDTVRGLLRAIYRALAPGGTLLLSEPMSGGARPTKAGDAYFGFYTMAMTTGRPRSAARHGEMLREAGFERVTSHPTETAFVTGVITARKPGPENV